MYSCKSCIDILVDHFSSHNMKLWRWYYTIMILYVSLYCASQACYVSEIRSGYSSWNSVLKLHMECESPYPKWTSSQLWVLAANDIRGQSCGAQYRIDTRQILNGRRSPQLELFCACDPFWFYKMYMIESLVIQNVNVCSLTETWQVRS